MHIGLSVIFFKGLVMLGGGQGPSCMYGGHGEYWWCLHNLVSACAGSCTLKACFLEESNHTYLKTHIIYNIYNICMDIKCIITLFLALHFILPSGQVITLSQSCPRQCRWPARAACTWSKQPVQNVLVCKASVI
eukprot:jgi/Botrbrau1/19790/Bobra.0124s0038.1